MSSSSNAHAFGSNAMQGQGHGPGPSYPDPTLLPRVEAAAQKLKNSPSGIATTYVGPDGTPAQVSGTNENLAWRFLFSLNEVLHSTNQA